MCLPHETSIAGLGPGMCQVKGGNKTKLWSKIQRRTGITMNQDTVPEMLPRGNRHMQCLRDVAAASGQVYVQGL